MMANTVVASMMDRTNHPLIRRVFLAPTTGRGMLVTCIRWA
jgi:hypothetical protein